MNGSQLRMQEKGPRRMGLELVRDCMALLPAIPH